MKRTMLIILFILLILNNCSRKKKEIIADDFSLPVVQIYTVQEKDLIPEIKTFGTIAFKTKVDIAPKTSGRIENIYTEQGKTVRKGQTIAVLEQLQLKIDLSQALAQLDGARSSLDLTMAKYKEALTNVERSFLAIEKAKAELEDKKNAAQNKENILNNKKKLLDAGAVTGESIRMLETEYHTYYTQYLIAERDLKMQQIGFRDKDIIDHGYQVPEDQEKRVHILKLINTLVIAKEAEVSRSNLKALQTKVDSIRAFLEETYIRAPMDGIIAARYVEAGEQAKPDTKLFTIMSIDQVYAKINVSESDLVRIKPDGRVDITVDALGGKKYSGLIELISPIIDTKTRTVEISVLLLNPNLELKPGMFVRAKIKSDQRRKTIFIPASSLISVEKDRANVFIVRNDLVFKKEVQLGQEDGEMVEIMAGLKNNELVIIEPGIDIQEGMNVQIQKE